MKLKTTLIIILLSQTIIACDSHHIEPKVEIPGEKPTLSEPGPDEPIRFATIQTQIFEVGQCLKCHDSVKAKGGVILENYEDILKDQLVIPGHPEKSSLYNSIASGDMPPRRPLPQESVDVLGQWIAEGAFLK